MVESTVIVKDSRFQIPVPLQEGVEALPNNLAVAQSRLENLRKKAMKDDDLGVFLTQSFRELQDSNYIEFVKDGVKKPEARRLWYEGPDFLKQNVNKLVIEGPSVSVKRVACGQELEELYFPDNSQLEKLIESSPSLYVLTKRVAYLAAFVDYIRCKAKNREFVSPRLDTCDLDMALNKIVGFVQRKYYGRVLSLMRSDSPEGLTEAIEKLVGKIVVNLKSG